MALFRNVKKQAGDFWSGLGGDQLAGGLVQVVPSWVTQMV